ncbi:MAG: hypothetical protein KDD60_09975, partial [Bdellovibrionales bacterium]|nr:hypothetical protein [Bdellovibrionales bacterium]
VMVLFCWVILRHRGLDEDFAQIGYEEFARWFPQRHLKKLRKELAPIVECDETFSYRIEGQERCFGFRFASHISGEDIVEVSLVSDRKRKFEEKKREKSVPYFIKNGFDLPVHEKLANCFPLFEFDQQRLMPVLAALPIKKRPIAERQAECWMAHQYFLTVGDTRRIYSSAANMKKELRAILRFKGEELTEIDVSCCQPVLLSKFLKGNIPEEEYLKYLKLTQEGLLYGEIASDIGETREWVKMAMVKWLCGPWFHDEPYYDPDMVNHKDLDERAKYLKLQSVLKPVNAWFRVNFPAVTEYMRSEKNNGDYWRQFNTIKRRRSGKSRCPYAIIAYRLQTLEAQIVIETCCKALFESDPTFPILTAHDALIVPVSRRQAALEAMIKSFESYGLAPKISIKGGNKVVAATTLIL